MEYLENRTFNEIQIGDTATLVRTLTEKDIQVFAIMSGDINPAHVDIEYAQSDMFHKIIGHGMWSGALISTVLGTQLPGPGTIYVGQTIQFKRPVGIGDTLKVTVTAIEKKSEKHRVIFSCECRNQEEQVVLIGQAEVVAPTKKIRRPKARLPEISLRRPYSLFDVYLSEAKKLGPMRTAIIHPIHKKIIEATHAASLAGIIQPIFIGEKKHILKAAEEANINITSYEFIEAEQHHVAISKAIALARSGKVNILVRGGATKEDLLRAMQKHHTGLLTERHLSYATILDVPTYEKALILTDTLINIDPSLDVKRAITQNAIDFARTLNIKKPKVAILAGMDTVNANLHTTVDAAALCKMAERGQIKDGIVDGPLTFENIISAEIAITKDIHSQVVGKADIILVPNVETGHILAEQLEYLAESKNAGLLLGGSVPVLMSHITDIYTCLVSCALAVLSKHHQRKYSEVT